MVSLVGPSSRMWVYRFREGSLLLFSGCMENLMSGGVINVFSELFHIVFL